MLLLEKGKFAYHISIMSVLYVKSFDASYQEKNDIKAE